MDPTDRRLSARERKSSTAPNFRFRSSSVVLEGSEQVVGDSHVTTVCLHSSNQFAPTGNEAFALYHSATHVLEVQHVRGNRFTHAALPLRSLFTAPIPEPIGLFPRNEVGFSLRRRGDYACDKGAMRYQPTAGSGVGAALRRGDSLKRDSARGRSRCSTRTRKRADAGKRAPCQTRYFLASFPATDWIKPGRIAPLAK